MSTDPRHAGGKPAGDIPAPEPYPNADDLPFWEATKQDRLVLPKCTA